MIVTTRKLDATDTEADRIRVTGEDGASATFSYPYREGLDGREAHAWAVRRLFSGDEFGEPVWIEEAPKGERFRVPGGEALAEQDKVRANDVTLPLEERRSALRRHNQRSAQGVPMGRAAVNTIAREVLGRHMTKGETERAEAARLELTGSVSGSKEGRDAFRLGALEFKGDVITDVGPDLIEAYDVGREFMHRVTDRQFETS